MSVPPPAPTPPAKPEATEKSQPDWLLHETRHGSFLAFATDAYIGRSLDVYGEYGAEELDLLKQLLGPGAVAVEVGANIGAHSIPLARLCSPGRFYAYEPQQRAFQLLCANLVLNGIDNAVCYPLAAGERAGFAQVPELDYRRPNNFGGIALSHGVDPAANAVSTPVTTVDALGLEHCALLKIDVEGWEPAVLRGARATIERCRPAIYVENDRADQQQEVISVLDGFGYQSFWHVAPLFSPHNPKGVVEDVFEGVCSLNMLSVPKENADRIGGLEPVDPKTWRSPIPVAPVG